MSRLQCNADGSLRLVWAQPKRPARRRICGASFVGAPARLTDATMHFLQEFYLGFRHLTPHANLGVYKHISDRLRIESLQVDTTAGYAGSCHVLEMGRHYSEYVRYRGRFPAFRSVPGFPAGNYLRQLDTKSRASNITGNIGEIIAGIVARRTLKIDPGGIAHLKTNIFSKTPDYLLNPTTDFEQILADIEPSLAAVTLPDWWPLESKARAGGRWRDVLMEALRQLAAYWYYHRHTAPQRVGYGVVVATEFGRPRRVRVFIFAPSNQAALVAYLNTFVEYKDYKDDFDNYPDATGVYIMNYA